MYRCAKKFWSFINKTSGSKSVNKDLINQLKGCAINAYERKCENAVAQMFAFHLKFVSNCLLKWFNRKFKIQNMETDHKGKLHLKLLIQ